MSFVKLRQWVAREGVHYQTAWRWWRDAKLPVSARQTATGTILVEVSAAGGVAAGVVVHTRVSSHDQRAGLDQQVAQVTEWVTGQGLYDRRGARNRALRAVTAVKKAGVDAAA